MLNNKKRKFVIGFIIITAVGVLLAPVPHFIMLANSVLLTPWFARGWNGYRGLLYKCLTISLLLWCGIAAISGLTMLFAPEWYGSEGFNFYMGGVLLAAILAVKAKQSVMNMFKHLEHERYAFALELVLVSFLTFVLPLYYRSIANESARQWGIFGLSFVCVLAIVGLLFNRMMKLENQRCELATLIEQQEAYRQQVLTQFEKVVTLKHFYNTLYQSFMPFIMENDMDGLRIYFEKYVTPIHGEYIQTCNQFNLIENVLIRNLLMVTAGQAATMKNITLDMDISGKIKLSDDIEMDIFEILCNLLDNAINELTEQESGLLRIWIRVIDNLLTIYIANTLVDDIDISKLYKEKNKSDGHGYGLQRIRAIVYQNTDMEHYTSKDGKYQGKDIFVQRIKVEL